MVHEMTGVTGTVKANSGAIVGFVSADISVEKATGKYNELGTNLSVSHTRGLVSITGTLRKAWGITSGDIWDWFDQDSEYDIVFDAKNDTTLTITASSCILTSVSVEGFEAGSEEVLMLNAPFEGLAYSYLDST
jgi:hypothetical protein